MTTFQELTIEEFRHQIHSKLSHSNLALKLKVHSIQTMLKS